jgi:hypothetical protein
MSPQAEVLCSGAPRDLGLDQGLRFREVIRAEVERLRGNGTLRLRAFLSSRDPELPRLARDTARFFPHLAERAEGIARGARVSTAELAMLLARDCSRESETLVGARIKADGSGASIALSTEREAPLFVRSSRPESGYRSLEIGIPWRVSALAGVNERGLAVAGSSLVSISAPLSTCAAPAVLLVQECLQRFDRVEKALEWCERRPAGGSASILLADAGGVLARVDLAGERRRIHREMDGILLGGGERSRLASVEKACRAGQPLDAKGLLRILAALGGRAMALDPNDPERILGDLP